MNDSLLDDVHVDEEGNPFSIQIRNINEYDNFYRDLPLLPSIPKVVIDSGVANEPMTSAIANGICQELKGVRELHLNNLRMERGVKLRLPPLQILYIREYCKSVDLSLMENLGCLEELYIFTGKVKHYSELCRLEQLKTLVLKNVKSEQCECVRSMRQLAWLGLYNSKLSHMEFLSSDCSYNRIELKRCTLPGIKELERVDLSGALVLDYSRGCSDLSPLCGKKLTELHAVMIGAVESFKPISKIETLEHLLAPKVTVLDGDLTAIYEHPNINLCVLSRAYEKKVLEEYKGGKISFGFQDSWF